MRGFSAAMDAHPHDIPSKAIHYERPRPQINLPSVARPLRLGMFRDDRQQHAHGRRPDANGLFQFRSVASGSQTWSRIAPG